MFNLPLECFSKDWINLNPRKDPSSADLYYNPKKNLFSLSPVFEKSALPKIYESLARNYSLKLSLPFLKTNAHFIDEFESLSIIDRNLMKPNKLEDFADPECFLQRLRSILNESKKAASPSKTVTRPLEHPTQSLVPRSNINQLTGSEPTIYAKNQTTTTLPFPHRHERTLKFKRNPEAVKITAKNPPDTSLPNLSTTIESFKKYLCSPNTALIDFQPFRFEDCETLKSFISPNKNEVALFYEIIQRVHKIKPVFTYSSVENELKTLGKLTLDGKPMLQVISASKKDAKKDLCLMALDIFFPHVKALQSGQKRKAKPLLNPTEKRKKVKTTNEAEVSAPSDELIKDPMEIMKGFENINKILGKSPEDYTFDPDFETIENPPLFEDENDPFGLLMRDIFNENNVNNNVSNNDLGFEQREPNELAKLITNNVPANQNYNDLQSLVTNVSKSNHPKQNPNNTEASTKKNLTNKNTKISGSSSRPIEREKEKFAAPMKKLAPNEKGLLNNKPNVNPSILNNSNEDGEELEEELKRICGKKVISIDDLLRDMGSPGRTYPVASAIELLERLLKFYSIKSNQQFKIFTIKDKDIIRVSIQRKDNGTEVCFTRNESPSLSKYFCLVDFFKLKFGTRCTLNEILVKLQRKQNLNPPKNHSENKKDEKVASSEVRGLLEDIESFQYSKNTINNRKANEEESDSDTGIPHHSKQTRDRKQQNVEKASSEEEGDVIFIE